MNESYRKHYQDAKEYSGWTNYPTWAVHLWISNDQGTWEHWIDRARAISADVNPLEPLHCTREQAAVYALEDELKDDAADNDLGAGTVNGDLLVWAYSMVNWREIAEALVEAAQS